MTSACSGDSSGGHRVTGLRQRGGEGVGARHDPAARSLAEPADMGQPVIGRSVVQPLRGQIAVVGLGHGPGLHDRGPRPQLGREPHVVTRSSSDWAAKKVSAASRADRTASASNAAGPRWREETSEIDIRVSHQGPPTVTGVIHRNVSPASKNISKIFGPTFENLHFRAGRISRR